jgi:hypothetical protein
VKCSACQTALPAANLDLPGFSPCPGCGAALRAPVFPALFRNAAEVVTGGEPVLAGESACFYHPEKRAVVPCAGCGRFLCALCEVELSGGHYCPNCIETGRSKGRMEQLVARRRLYDNLALALVLVPLIVLPVFWMTVVTAPMALYYAIRHWNAPSSLLPRTRVRLWIAVVFAGVLIAFWGLVAVWMLSDARNAVVVTP